MNLKKNFNYIPWVHFVKTLIHPIKDSNELFGCAVFLLSHAVFLFIFK